MKLNVQDVPEEERGVVSPCGIVCLGCDFHQGEGLAAAESLLRIWKGFNLEDAASGFGLTGEEVGSVLKTLEKFTGVCTMRGNCPGCFKGGVPSKVCGIARCVRSKGYWTCAECPDYDPESDRPCPNDDPEAQPRPIGDRAEMSALINRRYSETTRQNLRRCREIGYPEFIKKAGEKVSKGWRTWQVISMESVFSRHRKGNQRPG